MALQHWQGLGRPSRTKILTVRGGYHGDTAGAMSVCDPVTGMHSLFASYVAQQLFAPPPRPTYDEPVRDDDLAGVARLLEQHTDQVAAVIVEPVVQGAGGMRFYAPEYLRRLRALCDEHDVLLVLDEIATGFGRTGELFGADHAGVVGDIVCVGKALTGGYLSLAATLCTDAVAEAVSACGALMHGPTFMANPLGCAMGLASTRLLLSRPWREEVAGIAAGLREGLAPAAELPGVRDVRVLGAIGVVELHEPVDLRVVQPALVARGAWVRPFGRLVYAMPPFVSTPEDVAVVTSAIVGAVRDTC
jgi:adenosylmethionine-8-amino-7-oxononanoate aminotransferase